MSAEFTSEQIFEKIAEVEHFRIDKNFKGKDVISIEQFTPGAVKKVMETAVWIEKLYASGKRSEYSHLLDGKRLMVNFGEQSTRTYSSFVAAAIELGAMVVDIPDAFSSSSFGKGETLEDTMRTYEAQKYAGIIMRHPDDDSALRVALHTEIPIISGGSGKLEHPTQALLDFYTVLKETGKKPEDLHIAFIGDLKHGRTVHSLVKLMEIMGNKEMSFVSPDIIKMPRNIIESLCQKGITTHETSNLKDIVTADVFYMTRVQKERFAKEEDYYKVKDAYQIDTNFMKLIKLNAVLMHPLPRIEEIKREVDNDPRAAYFRQVENGLYVRMALLYLIFGNY